MKVVATVFAARQFISHGHISVNGRRVTVPSYQIKLGDVIEVRGKAKDYPFVQEAITSSERDVPDRSEEHTSELQSLMRNSYAVFCLKTKKQQMHNMTKRHTKPLHT